MWDKHPDLIISKYLVLLFDSSEIEVWSAERKVVFEEMKHKRARIE